MLSLNNTLIRRAAKRYFYRYIKCLFYQNKVANPILINSIPKSGTHLLDQCFVGFPHYADFGEFIASFPGYTKYPRQKHEIMRLLHRIRRNEIFRGHIFFSEMYSSFFEENKFIHFFMIRDPRDLVVSEAYYLKYLAVYHKLHVYFKTLSMDDAIATSIQGIMLPNLHYPSFSDRILPYLGWLSKEYVNIIRFEDLLSFNNSTLLTLIDIVYPTYSRYNISKDFLFTLLEYNLNNRKSHTFRKGGGKGSWRNAFSSHHLGLFDKYNNGVLEKLGYKFS